MSHAVGSWSLSGGHDSLDTDSRSNGAARTIPGQYVIRSAANVSEKLPWICSEDQQGDKVFWLLYLSLCIAFNPSPN